MTGPARATVFGDFELRAELIGLTQWHSHQIRIEFSFMRRLGDGALALLTAGLPLAVAFPFCFVLQSAAPLAQASQIQSYSDPEVKHRRPSGLRAPIEDCSLQFVLDGVVVAEERGALKGWNGVVSTRGLSTDLSGFGLVRNWAYHARIQFLRERRQWAEAETGR